MVLVSFHELVTLSPWKARVGRCSFESQEESFTRKRVRQHLDLGVLNLQELFIINQYLLQYFVIAAEAK